jgi:hypothetical protein
MTRGLVRQLASKRKHCSCTGTVVALDSGERRTVQGRSGDGRGDSEGGPMGEWQGHSWCRSKGTLGRELRQRRRRAGAIKRGYARWQGRPWPRVVIVVHVVSLF